MQRKKEGGGQRAQGLVPSGSPAAWPTERGEGGARGHRCAWAAGWLGRSLLIASVFCMKQESMSAPETKDRRGSVGL